MNEKQILAVTKYLGTLGLSDNFNVLYSLANEIKSILEINASSEIPKSSIVPPWAKYRAMNNEGTFLYFENCPTRYGNSITGFWMADGNSGQAAFFEGWENSVEEIK